MEGGEGAEDDGGVGEADCVSTATEQFVDTREPAWRTLHPVVGWRKTMDDLVPRWRTGEQDLDENTEEVRVSEYFSPEVQRWFRAEEV